MDRYFHYDGLLFEWDPMKAELNRKKHGITFEEAMTVFGDALAQIFSDPDHSAEEERFLLVGVSEFRRVLIVISVERGEVLRLISARKATPEERRSYEESAR
jgi:uncharacterized DUF497 family protein